MERTPCPFFLISSVGVRPLPEAAWEAEARLEALLARSRAVIEHRGARAYYQPGEDRIVLPPRGRFPSAAAYYGTAFHELGHWTGHERRLNRPFSFDRSAPDYAREELRAELASAFLNAELGCPHDYPSLAFIKNAMLRSTRT